MNDLASEASEVDTGTPRLGISHIMLWTAMSAAHVALLRWIYGQQEVPEEFAVVQRASGIVHGIIVGAQWMGAIVLIDARVKGVRPKLISNPGHWMLLIQAFSATLGLGMYTILTVLFERIAGPPYQNLYFVFYGLLLLATTAVYLFAAWRTKLIRWKVIFLAISALGVLQGLSYLIGIPFAIDLFTYTMMLTSYARFVVSLWVIVVAIWDFAAKQRFDWLHWLGVAAYLAGVYAMLLQMVWQWLMQP